MAEGGGISVYIGTRGAAVVAAVVALAAGAFAVPVITGGGGGGGDLVNLGVVDSGTCDSTPTRESTAVALGSLPAGALACTIAQATSAASSGDEIGLEAGTHEGQTTWGDGTKVLTYLGEDGAIVDCGSSDSNYDCFAFTAHATVRNVDLIGDYPIVGFFASDTEWSDSTYFSGREIRTCASDEPTLIEGDSDVEYQIEDVRVMRMVFQAHRAVDVGCSGGDGLHLETIRVGKAVRNVRIERSVFEACVDGASWNGCGSGHIFVTTTAVGLLEPQDLVVRNNKFFATPNYVMQMHNNVRPCTGWVFAYNSSTQEAFGFDSANACIGGSSVTVTGNAMPRPQNCISGFTYVRNMWEAALGTPCGTDQRDSDLQLDANLDPEVGSPVIDAGETPGASDYCTGDLGSVDIDGSTRPLGSVCDAGAVEAS